MGLFGVERGRRAVAFAAVGPLGMFSCRADTGAGREPAAVRLRGRAGVYRCQCPLGRAFRFPRTPAVLSPPRG
eukprot:7601877-Lingulodinium_polyedra.AAC.1